MSDEEAKNKARTDQNLAQIRDAVPSLWWAIYSGCIQQGFLEEQALRLVIAFIQRPGS